MSVDGQGIAKADKLVVFVKGMIKGEEADVKIIAEKKNYSFGIIDNVSFFLGLPLLLYGSNVVLRQQVLRGANLNEKVHRTSYFIAGIMLALSVCVWYQCSFVVLAILLMLCVKHDHKGALMTLIGFVVTLLIIWLILFLLNVNPWSYVL